MKFLQKTRATATIAALAAATAFTQSAMADNLRAEVQSVGNGAYLAMVGLKGVMEKHTEHTMEVSAGYKGTETMVKLGRGAIDVGSIIMTFYPNMQEKTGVFAKLSNGPELADNIRSMIGFPAGTYHIITRADSGITTLADVKGKTVFLGPANSGSEIFGKQIISSESGLEAGSDYQLLNVDFAGGEQAFLDNQIDVYLRLAPLGSTSIDQLGAKGGIRLLGLSEKGLADPRMVAALNRPGGGSDVIDPSVYSSLVNEEAITTLGFSLGLGFNKNVDEQTVYDITKALWENFDAFKATSKNLFGSMSKENALSKLNAPLHAGAYRYFKEVGVTVPDYLVPSEAKG